MRRRLVGATLVMGCIAVATRPAVARDLPDLVITNVQLQSSGGCGSDGALITGRIDVKNIGPDPIGEFRVNGWTHGDQYQSAVAAGGGMDEEGDYHFVITWTGQAGIIETEWTIETVDDSDTGSGDGTNGSDNDDTVQFTTQRDIPAIFSRIIDPPAEEALALQRMHACEQVNCGILRPRERLAAQIQEMALTEVFEEDPGALAVRAEAPGHGDVMRLQEL